MRKALIVDDEGPIRNLIAAVLKRERITSSTAPNGIKALDLLRKETFACVVLDLMMPVMNGREVIEEMLHHRVPRVPVIVVTASGEGGTADLDPKVVKVIIRKPFDVARVVEAVRAFCSDDADDADEEVDASWPADAPRVTM